MSDRKKKGRPKKNANPSVNEPLPSRPSLTYGQVDYIALYEITLSATGVKEAALLDFGGDDEAKTELPVHATVKQLQNLLRAYRATDTEILVEYCKHPPPGESEPIIIDKWVMQPVGSGTQQALPAQQPDGHGLALADEPEEDDEPDAAGDGTTAPQATAQASSNEASPAAQAPTTSAAPSAPVDHGGGGDGGDEPPDDGGEEEMIVPSAPPDRRPVRRKRGGQTMAMERLEEDAMFIPGGLTSVEEIAQFFTERNRRDSIGLVNALHSTNLENTRSMVSQFGAGMRDIMGSIGVHDEFTRRLRSENYELKEQSARQRTDLLAQISRLTLEVDHRRSMHFTEVDILRKQMQALELEVRNLKLHIEDERRRQEQLRKLEEDPENKDMMAQLWQMGVEKFGPRILNLVDSKFLSKVMPETAGT